MRCFLFILFFIYSCSSEDSNELFEPLINQNCNSQVCLSLDGNNLHYISNKEISGFQFDHDNCITGAMGGDTEANNFTISLSNYRLLSFSLSGNKIEQGSGILLILEGDVEENCLDNFIFAGNEGINLTINWN